MSNPYENATRKKSVLGPTLRFKGELSAEEDLLIQGRVEGSIKHSSSLTVGEEGQVKADIDAEYIAVEGKVKGDLSGSQSVVVRDTADIEGNIFSPVVTLLEGSTFNGSIDMSGKKRAEVKEPEPEVKPAEATSEKRESESGSEPSTSAKKRASRAKSASAA